MTYLENIQNAMRYISNNKQVLFIGQSTSVPGNLIHKSLIKDRKTKNPLLAEDAQMGMAISPFFEWIFVCAILDLFLFVST